MKLITNQLIIALLFSICYGCVSVNKVAFKIPVDTRSNNIQLQDRKTFFIDDLGVYASNQFDGARLNDFQKINDSTVQVIVNPENQPINKSAYYAFKVWSEKERLLYLKFQYPKGHKHRYQPKLYKDNKWELIDTVNVYKQDSIVTVKVQIEKKPLTIAAQEIQSSTDVKNWYTALIKGKEAYVHFKNFGKSALGRDLPVLDIYKGNKKEKPIIVLLTRQHPPEVTGYFAFQEFLKAILNESSLSHDFLNKYRVLAFPIMNPDGVDLGHWRHNAQGIDLNRDWSVYRQPEIRQAVKYITKQIKKDKTKIILGLDFHSTYEDVFYTNKIREKTTMPQFIESWFTALEANIPDYNVNESSANSTRPVSKGWFLYGHDAVGITYEIGDATPRERIKEIGKTSAVQMMKILNNYKPNSINYD
ncbi:hypothetical protein GTQ40_17305 [Flavobacteriaceae bacterium R38]|nr:hypothetical protein [Flavobacteriaceae bacterium R38]